ncbi:hypothetical protein SBA4_250006 [Candidatus Sulfopaludibacter sp. SbA4]|nr:hypothetical protein SBA4_250006 [Candidatus Sulfopaludibacter sp. SbA4]
MACDRSDNLLFVVAVLELKGMFGSIAILCRESLQQGGNCLVFSIEVVGRGGIRLRLAVAALAGRGLR